MAEDVEDHIEFPCIPETLETSTLGKDSRIVIVQVEGPLDFDRSEWTP